VLLLAVFTYKPLLESFYYSTLQWNIGSQVAREVGLANYVAWFQDPQTPTVVGVTVVFTGVTVVGSMVLGLGVAVLLNRRIRLRGPVRTIIVAPYVLSGVAVGFLWLYVFDPNFGLISAGLSALGLPSPDWYSDPGAALAMVTTVQVWRDLGYCALIYFVRIVLPMLSPTTFFLSVTTLLSSLQTFDLISAMTKGGPLQGTTTMMYQIYHEGFVAGRAGYSSAVATILFLVLLVVTLVQLVIVQRKVHYS
jgi:sn-glycerol 3-phosphate transport system permease protein